MCSVKNDITHNKVVNEKNIIGICIRRKYYLGLSTSKSRAYIHVLLAVVIICESY